MFESLLAFSDLLFSHCAQAEFDGERNGRGTHKWKAAQPSIRISNPQIQKPYSFAFRGIFCRSRNAKEKVPHPDILARDSIVLPSIAHLTSTCGRMQRHVLKLLLRRNTIIRAPASPSPSALVFPHCFRLIHTTTPQFKRDSASKSRHREEKKAAKQKLEETLSEAEEWLATHDPDQPDVIQNRKAMLLEQTDPFEWDAYVQNLKDIVDKLRKEGSLLRQGKSDPEMLKGLHVELPENLGGKQRFLDVATVGPKPGDARSLLISVYDVEVRCLCLCGECG